MKYTDMLLRSYNRRFENTAGVLASFESKLRKPSRFQKATLQTILQRNTSSEYGVRHGFGGIASYGDFRRKVPIVQYEELRPYVRRMLQGEENVLLAGKASYFSTTSGSTGSPKFVPGTQQSIVAGCEAILARNSYLWRDHPLAFSGPPLFVVGNASEGKTEDGIGYGAMTGFGYHVGHIGFAHPAFPYDVFTISNYAARYYWILRLALACRNLSAIAIYNPSTLLLLLETARARWDELVEDIRTGGASCSSALPDGVGGELRAVQVPDAARANELRSLGMAGPCEWWPQLAALMCWKGGTLGFYLHALRSWIGDLPVRDLGLFASEALIAIPVDDQTAGGVLLPESGFFEFVPTGGRDDQAIPAWGLEQSGTYRVVITTYGGLYRYDLGDVVRVEGWHFKMPLLTFLHRAGRVYSFTGEKLTEQQVTEAVLAAANRQGICLVGFAAVPVWQHPPYYELRVEIRSEPTIEVCRQLANGVDRELKRVNMEYASKRDSGRLAPVSVSIVEASSFENLRRSQTQSDAQYKDIHLATDPNFGCDMRVIARASII